MSAMSGGKPFHRGTHKEQAAKRLQGRQCTFVEQYEGRNGGRRCTNKTGKNYFFCKKHFEWIDDTGVELGKAL